MGRTAEGVFEVGRGAGADSSGPFFEGALSHAPRKNEKPSVRMRKELNKGLPLRAHGHQNMSLPCRKMSPDASWVLPPPEKSATSGAMKRLHVAVLAAFFACAGLLFPGTASADEPEPVHRYEDDRRPPGSVRTKLFLTGAAVTGAFYAPALGASYLWDQHPGASRMRIPIAGPWLGFSKTKLCNARPDLEQCNNFLVVTGAVLLVLDGIGQAGGAGLLLESIFLPTGPRRAVRGGSSEVRLHPPTWEDQVARRPLTFHEKSFSITPVPTVGGQSDVGLSFVGQF